MTAYISNQDFARMGRRVKDRRNCGVAVCVCVCVDAFFTILARVR